jgi:hypothetical protein
MYNCRSDCVYNREDEPGMNYCRGEGDQEVKCIELETIIVDDETSSPASPSSSATSTSARSPSAPSPSAPSPSAPSPSQSEATVPDPQDLENRLAKALDDLKIKVTSAQAVIKLVLSIVSGSMEVVSTSTSEPSQIIIMV